MVDRDDKKRGNREDNVSYLPTWMTAGRQIKPEQSIIYRALKEYLNRVNQNYEAAESRSLKAQKALEEQTSDPHDTSSKK